DSSCWRSYINSNSAGGRLPIDVSNRRWLNQSTHSSVAYSTSSSCRQLILRLSWGTNCILSWASAMMDARLAPGVTSGERLFNTEKKLFCFDEAVFDHLSFPGPEGRYSL